MKSGIRNPRLAASFGLRDPLVDLAGDFAQASQIVLGVAPVADRVNLGEKLHQSHVQTPELIEDKAVVFKGLAADHFLHVPFDQSGRHRAAVRRAFPGRKRRGRPGRGGQTPPARRGRPW